MDLMDGPESEIFAYFKSLLIKGFFSLRRHLDDMLILIEIMMKSKFHALSLDSNLPCFVN